MTATGAGWLGRPGGTSWLATIVSTRRAAAPADIALAAVRAALTWIFVYYGAGKLFGAFNGPGLSATADFMAGTAHLHPGGLFAVLAGVIELGGAIAMALGLGARLAGLALSGDMLVAIITVTGSRGINSEQVPPGYELNVALGVLALVIALLGAGRYSADAVIERRLAAGPGPGTAA